MNRLHLLLLTAATLVVAAASYWSLKSTPAVEAAAAPLGLASSDAAPASADVATVAGDSAPPASAAAESSTADAEPETAVERQLSVREWTSREPESAAAWVLALAPGEKRTSLLEQVALGWCDVDLPAAIAWVRKLPAEHASIVAMVAIEAARTDPVAALTIAADLPANPARDELCRHAASQWALADRAAAVSWAEGIGDEALREKVSRAIAFTAPASAPRAE